MLSPRLNTLLEEIQTDEQQALDTFWQEIFQQGTPLVEHDDNTPQLHLVTFLWRAETPIENVVVIGQLGTGQEFTENCMQRLSETNVWYKTYQLRSDLRAAYSLSPDDSLVPYHKVEDWLDRVKTWRPDPLNPNLLAVPEQPKPLSTFELPDAAPQPWWHARSDVPAGNLEETRFHSKILDNERIVWVYTPPGYEAKIDNDAEPYHLLVLFDGEAYRDVMHVQNTLDNLLAAKQIPPFVALFVDNIDFGVRALELGCHPPFASFVVDELLPWAATHYHATSDPSRVIVGGVSMGGLAAAHIGLMYSDRVGNVLSHSGSFWWQPAGDEEHEWLTRQFVLAEKRPLTVYLDVGLLETEATYRHGPSMVVVNRHMRNVLDAKGYTVHYREYAGGHDYLYWRGSFADGLLALVNS